jgi:hypothetical protein
VTGLAWLGVAAVGFSAVAVCVWEVVRSWWVRRGAVLDALLELPVPYVPADTTLIPRDADEVLDETQLLWHAPLHDNDTAQRVAAVLAHNEAARHLTDERIAGWLSTWETDR